MRRMVAIFLFLAVPGAATFAQPAQNATVPPPCIVSFSSDPAHPLTLLPVSGGCLDQLAAALKQNPRLVLVLTGSAPHATDPALALNRAITAKDYLTVRESIAGARITTMAGTASSNTVIAALRLMPASVPRPTMLAEPTPVLLPPVNATPPLAAAADQPAPLPQPVRSAAPPPPRKSSRTATFAPQSLPRTTPKNTQLATVAGQPSSTVSPPVVSAADPYAVAKREEAWKNSLHSGKIDYTVPHQMTAQQASTVAVVIHGFQDQQQAVLPGPVVTGTLKVADMMKVELVPLNPSEFVIVPESGQNAVQFIPIDGHTTWIWSVTPANQANSQQLLVRVSLVPEGKDAALLQPLVEQTYVVDVTVQSFWTDLKQRWQKDPLSAVAYIMPGGAGWAAIAGILTTLGVGTWLKSKFSKDKPRSAQPEPLEKST